MLPTIAVHLDHTERCEIRTLLAARLARRHHSHLMGIVPTGCDTARPPPGAQEAADALVEASLYLRRRAETVAHVFRSRLMGPVPLSCGARLVDGEPVQAVVRLGRASDLVVVGQADEAATVSDVVRRLPEDVMLDVGRPVLIVPREGRIAPAFDRVVVAWDSSREASISLRGAMPLLRKAAHVTLLTLVRPEDANAAHAPDPSEMSGWLLRHGVQADVERLATSLRWADALLHRVEVSEADLLVMGGYGHPRLRERMLGGVTRDVLARATLPVLMAH
ncbi:universal stress protein [Variovorax boronicumulans]|uniref:universal stress protein n=1 Tax=Variovorax boronicumulans TaxID=436515 RepID=UPI003390A2DD